MATEKSGSFDTTGERQVRSPRKLKIALVAELEPSIPNEELLKNMNVSERQKYLGDQNVQIHLALLKTINDKKLIEEIFTALLGKEIGDIHVKNILENSSVLKKIIQLKNFKTFISRINSLQITYDFIKSREYNNPNLDSVRNLFDKRLIFLVENSQNSNALITIIKDKDYSLIKDTIKGLELSIVNKLKKDIGKDKDLGIRLFSSKDLFSGVPESILGALIETVSHPKQIFEIFKSADFAELNGTIEIKGRTLSIKNRLKEILVESTSRKIGNDIAENALIDTTLFPKIATELGDIVLLTVKKMPKSPQKRDILIEVIKNGNYTFLSEGGKKDFNTMFEEIIDEKAALYYLTDNESIQGFTPEHVRILLSKISSNPGLSRMVTFFMNVNLPNDIKDFILQKILLVSDESYIIALLKNTTFTDKIGEKNIKLLVEKITSPENIIALLSIQGISQSTKNIVKQNLHKILINLPESRIIALLSNPIIQSNLSPEQILEVAQKISRLDDKVAMTKGIPMSLKKFNILISSGASISDFDVSTAKEVLELIDSLEFLSKVLESLKSYEVKNFFEHNEIKDKMADKILKFSDEKLAFKILSDDKYIGIFEGIGEKLLEKISSFESIKIIYTKIPYKIKDTHLAREVRILYVQKLPEEAIINILKPYITKYSYSGANFEQSELNQMAQKLSSKGAESILKDVGSLIDFKQELTYMIVSRVEGLNMSIFEYFIQEYRYEKEPKNWEKLLQAIHKQADLDTLVSFLKKFLYEKDDLYKWLIKGVKNREQELAGEEQKRAYEIRRQQDIKNIIDDEGENYWFGFDKEKRAKELASIYEHLADWEKHRLKNSNDYNRREEHIEELLGKKK